MLLAPALPTGVTELRPHAERRGDPTRPVLDVAPVMLVAEALADEVEEQAQPGRSELLDYQVLVSAMVLGFDLLPRPDRAGGPRTQRGQPGLALWRPTVGAAGSRVLSWRHAVDRT
jgi:hypothetical protein